MGRVASRKRCKILAIIKHVDHNEWDFQKKIYGCSEAGHVECWSDRRGCCGQVEVEADDLFLRPLTGSAERGRGCGCFHCRSGIKQRAFKLPAILNRKSAEPSVYRLKKLKKSDKGQTNIGCCPALTHLLCFRNCSCICAKLIQHHSSKYMARKLPL